MSQLNDIEMCIINDDYRDGVSSSYNGDVYRDIYVPAVHQNDYRYVSKCIEGRRSPELLLQ